MVAANLKTSKIKDSNDSPSKSEQAKLVEQIKNSNNILITVSRDPSVDALSAALGLTAIIDKMEKHGTAIFSGKVPPAIEFLNPDKIFEDKADSLRDFIIALSRDKADHLRYKVDGDVVKIYVTPYKTIITEKDLEFSQGDYNVELVIALGVGDQKDLDAALAAHGRILHDATVTTINVGEETSKLGTINLHSSDASSLSEIVADISEQLNKDSNEKLLDEQIATALMTGIVATTDRFSNERTSSRTLAIAAILMGAGADQQLITTQLEEAKSEPQEQEPQEDATKEEKAVNVAKPDGSLSISHDESKTNSRLVISPPEKASKLATEESPEEVVIPTATEILSQLAAAQEAEIDETISSTEEIKEEPKEDETLKTDEALAAALAQQTSTNIEQAPSRAVKSSDTRSYLAPQDSKEEKIYDPPQEDESFARMSSEQSPSEGAEPLRGASSITTVVQPLSQIDPMAPPVVDPKPAADNLPQFNVDQSAEAILQAALNSASPAAELSGPALPPPPPPPAPDFSTSPPPLPDFSQLPPATTSTLPPIETTPVTPVEAANAVAPAETTNSAPVMSTLPPEDMILAGQNQPPSNDPTQFRIPGQ